MSEEVGVGAGLVVMEDEQMKDERKVREIWKWGSPVGEQSTVIMTGDEFTNGSMPVREVGDKELGSIEDPTSSQLGSFQSLHSSQSNNKDKMIPYAP